MTVSRRFPSLLLTLCAAAFAGGCSDDRDSQREQPIPTRMVVDPADFLGDVPCLQAPGAMRSYQATLFDVTDELPEHELEAPFPLPSSGLVPCEVPVQFQLVVPGHRYIARVSGFDIAPEDLRQPSPGFPAVVDSEGAVVPPRWTTTCHGTAEALAAALQAQGPTQGQSGAGGMGGASGLDDGASPSDIIQGAVASTNAQIRIRYCEPLADAGESPTGIIVNLQRALLGLRCGDGPGEVDSFEVHHPTLPAGTFTAACGDSVAVAPLPANREIEVDVTALGAAPSDEGGMGGAGGDSATEKRMTWVTRCRARTFAETLVEASCDPLVPADSP